MKSRNLIIVLVFLILWSCTKDQMPLETDVDNELRSYVRKASEDGSLEYFVLPDEEDLSSIPQDPKNPLTPEKVQLGKMLFYETGLAMDAVYPSGRGTYSCASCHIPEAGFRPGRAQGIADGGFGFGVKGELRVRNTEYEENEMDVQSARPLSLVNVAYVTNTFWNGQFGSTGANVGTEEVWHDREDTERNFLGFQGIETQNFEGLEAHRITVNKDLLDQFGYTEMFDDVFPEVQRSERYNQMTASLAISAYLRTILSNEAPFQRWLKGQSAAMSLGEKKGGLLFFSKARCYNCHYRPNLGSLEFHALGVNDMDQIPSFNTAPDDRRNLGRGGFTGMEEDNFKFKVPQLYNLDDAPFFFHGASKRTLEEVIDYKIEAQSENPRVDQELISNKFQPIDLTEEERGYLLTFLKHGLRDPDLVRYQPYEVLSGNCFPNNDPQSIIDLGCQ